MKRRQRAPCGPSIFTSGAGGRVPGARCCLWKMLRVPVFPLLTTEQKDTIICILTPDVILEESYKGCLSARRWLC